MKRRLEGKTAAAKLRNRAEKELKKGRPKHSTAEGDVHRLLHELQVYQVELELQNSELLEARTEAETAAQHYIELYEFAPVGYLTVVGQAGEILQSNFAAAALLGMERGDLSRKRLGIFVADPDRTTLKVFLEQLYNGSPGQTCDLRLDNPPGQPPRFVHLTGALDADGKTCRVTLLDFTQVREAEAALIASEKKFRALFDNARDALLANSPPDWQFNWANQAALQMFGYADEAQFYSLAPWEISPELQPDGQLSSEKAKQMAEKVLREGSHFFEWLHQRQDGTTFPAEVLLTRIEVNGKRIILGSIRDISTRKKLEKELRERGREMELLQRTQIATQTAIAIAHELNQPLLAIASYAKATLLMLDRADPDFPKIRDLVLKIERQALRGGKAMRDLLNSLSIKEFPKEPLDLNREIADLVTSARAEHPLPFRVNTHLEEGLPPVLANRTHVQRILTNLLYNGIEIMEQAGVPKPAILITVRTMKEQNVAQATIQDNGPGVKHEDIQRIFEPFFTSKPGGIGMGLAISRSLAEANGGQLWIDPEQGPGATFHLTLPFSP